MPRGAYKTPPITEAVIDFQFADACKLEELDRVRQRLSDTHPSVESIFEVSLNVGLEDQQVARNQIGYKLASTDQVDVVLLQTKGFTNSRLAPYDGWGNFRNRVTSNWSMYKGVMGYRKVSRIGVRYINRLDIPSEHVLIIDRSTYLKFGVTAPGELPSPLSRYSAQIVSQAESVSGTVIVTTATMPSPLVNHVSILLDIDVYRDENVPQRDEEIFSFIDQLRILKNELFEACVTDAARSLFDNG